MKKSTNGVNTEVATQEAKEVKVLTAKSTKSDIIDNIMAVYSQVKDKSLVDRVNYTSNSFGKDEASVSKRDLMDLWRDVKEAVVVVTSGIMNEKKPVEAQAKPVLGKAKATATLKAAETPKEEKGVKTSKPVNPKGLPYAVQFPDHIKHESLGNLVACKGSFLTMKDIKEALDNDRILIIAFYWSKRHIKEYDYKTSYYLATQPKAFPYDLDTQQVLFGCETIDRVFCMSTYTEGVSFLDAEDLEYVDGEEYKIRVSNGSEFEIYELVQEAPEEKAPEVEETPEVETPEEAPEVEEPKAKIGKSKAKSTPKK